MHANHKATSNNNKVAILVQWKFVINEKENAGMV